MRRNQLLWLTLFGPVVVVLGVLLGFIGLFRAGARAQAPAALIAALPSLTATVVADATTPATTPTPPAVATPTEQPTRVSSAAPLPTPTSYPYIYNVTDNVRAIYARGRVFGNYPNVFSKIGDSITVNRSFLAPIGLADYNLREYGYLQPAVDFFSSTNARVNNSFANISLSATVGWPSAGVLDADLNDPAWCQAGESPLECEYRNVFPSYALVMLGTNDVPTRSLEEYEANMRLVIEITLDRAVVPILSTIPPMPGYGQVRADKIAAINAIVIALAGEYDVPYMDYWAALQGLPDQGMGPDGIHPSLPPGKATDFTAANLQYGMTVRNLICLHAVDAVWRAAEGSP
jgi:hypothetical protein